MEIGFTRYFEVLQSGLSRASFTPTSLLLSPSPLYYIPEKGSIVMHVLLTELHASLLGATSFYVYEQYAYFGMAWSATRMYIRTCHSYHSCL